MKRQYYISELLDDIPNTVVNQNVIINEDVHHVLIAWKKQLCIDGIDYFDSMLKANSITEMDLLLIMKHYFSKSTTKETLDDAFQLFSGVNKNVPITINPFSKELFICSNEIADFISRTCLDRVKNQIEIISNNLFKILFFKISTIANECLSLEFEVVKHEGKLVSDKDQTLQYNQGFLSEESFIAYLKHEYPVLFRLVREETEKFTLNFKEFIVRFHSDIDDIIQSDAGFESHIIHIETHGSSRKHGAQTHSLQFESKKKLVYKPWNLDMQKVYGDFLLFISPAFKYQFKIPHLIVKDNYGWMEFITQHNSFSKTELKRFYHMAGNLLGLFYILDGTDLHMENIIYSESGPVIIDCETLFHPEEYALKNSHFKPTLESNDVLKTGPLVFLLNDKAADAHLFIDDCLDGFNECYSYFNENKALLYSKIKEMFHDVNIRVVLRDNKLYNHLLVQRLKPELMTDGYKSDMHFDWLWGHVNDLKYLEKVIPYEKSSLMKNEIPVFTTFFESRDLYYDELKVASNFFNYSASERLKLKLDRLGEKDLSKQLELIKKHG